MASVMNTAVASGAGLSLQTYAVRDVYSAEIFFAAQPIMKFDQFTTKKTELGTQSGRTIQMNKYGNLKRGGRLTEAVKIQTQGMSLTQSSITVYEYGNGIGFSEALLQMAFFDQLAAASMLLGRDLAIVLDLALRDVAVAGTNVIYGGGKASRLTLTSADVFDTSVIKDAVEALETTNSPKWANDHYICFCHPHQARGLRDDNDWINASLYAGATQIYMGEIGRYEDVRFISTTVMPNGANSAVDAVTGDYTDPGYVAALNNGAGDSSDVYQAVFFGEFAVGHAVGLPVELRDNGVADFGREHGLAWYAIFGQDILEDANLVIAETT
jgi:N4-gp56 family major capsid protein